MSAVERTFYRWVSDAELQDIRNVGELRAGPNSYFRGKLLTNSFENAVQWGKVFGEHPDAGAVITVTVTTEMEELFEYLGDNIDNIGPAWMAPFEALSGAQINE